MSPSHRVRNVLILALMLAQCGCFSYYVSMDPGRTPLYGVGVATGGTTTATAAINAAARPEGTLPLVYPLLRREPDCSLTRLLLDSTNLVFTQSRPHFELTLHAAARLTTTAGVYPNACADPTIGVGGRNLASGLLPNGSRFVAYQSINSPVQLKLYLETAGTLSARPNLVVTSDPFNYANKLAVADFNGDGKPDLAAAISTVGTSDPARLAVLLGDGIGGFAAPSYTPLSAAASTVSGITVADFNSDGKLDIIATASDGIIRLIGNGSGSFSTTLLGLVTGYGVIAADFNGDARLDLATGDGHILFGDGAGGFALAAGVRFGEGIPAAGDFNGDGKNDLVVLPQDGSSILYPWIGDGTGNFSRLDPGYSTVQRAGSSDLAVTDLDGDGNADVIVGSTGGGFYGPSINTSGQAHYLLGRGNGRFASPPALANAVLSSADFNGDGKADLLALEAVASTPGVRPQLGDGLGGFVPGVFSATAISIGFLNHRPLYIARDFSGDGKADLVAIEYITSTSAVIHTRLGATGGAFAGSGPDQAVAFGLPDYGNSSNRGAPAVADFNGDGKLDLALLGFNASSRALVLLTGNGDGSFATPATIDAGYGSAGSNVSRVATADLNSDGQPDIVVADPGPAGVVHVYRNLGSGVFSAAVLSGGTGTPGALDIGDVNGDGKPDLVTASEGGVTLSVRLGNGDATFQTPLESTLPDDSYISVVIGDIDADGKPDLILGNYSGFGWFARGDGSGHFAAPQVLPLVGSPAGLQLLDLDNNGHPDLIAHIGGYTLALGVYMNTWSATLFANGFDSP